MGWEPSYVAASVLLGESREASAESLSERALEGARRSFTAVSSPSKVARAKALASLAHAIAVALDRARVS